MAPQLILDLSRLLWRSGRSVPTGIDRVELEYAKHFITTSNDRLDFVANSITGATKFLRRRHVHRFISALDAVWQGDKSRQNQASVTRSAALILKLGLFGGRGGLAVGTNERPIYLHVSHHHLDRPTAIKHFKERVGARAVFMIHDLIPIEWPEYARPRHDRRHMRRMETVAALADGIILNSAATGRSFQPFLDRAKRSIPSTVALLGVAVPDTTPAATTPVADGRPYFVMVGTIEPRKNHLMLLAVWRQIASELGDQAPRLVLIGQRGWENENILDLLDRSPEIRRTVSEYNGLSDSEMATVLSGARALLLPSFAEGYGLPVAEALCAGVPVICSPLPAFREIGGDVPEYRDTLDGLGWRHAILDYADEHSALRSAQLARLQHWEPPNWAGHFAQVDRLIATVSGESNR